jgi:hypothetical protein
MSYSFPTKIMYALTYRGENDLRTLMRANQGRNHFETEEAANEYLAAVLSNNSADTLKMFPFLEVRPVECYMHGDAVGCNFGFEIFNKKCFACKKLIDGEGKGHTKDCPTLD